MSPSAEDLTRPYRQASNALLTALGADPKQGLADQEARARLELHGRNELATEEPASGWRNFLAQLANPLLILLLVAASVSAGLWSIDRKAALPYEAIAILAIVLINAVVGHWQQKGAELSLAKLREMSAAEATVLRSGERKRVPAAEIVPGDIVLLEEGDLISADARLIQSSALRTMEAALTGESGPVEKDTEPVGNGAGIGDRTNMVFSGTAVSHGRGQAVVTATGMQTEIGRIAGMLKAARKPITPLQEELDRLGRRLGVAVGVIALVLVGAILLIERVHGSEAFFDVLILGVALAVAAVPESLPAVVTVVLSLGVRRMAQRNAIVRQLSAVETLGSANIIASDKTGTLTRNEMTVRVVVTAGGRVVFCGSGYSPDGTVEPAGGKTWNDALRIELERALLAADRANNSVLRERDGRWSVQGDPTEGALVVAARKAGLKSDLLDARFERLAELPFSSGRNLMSTVQIDAGNRVQALVFTKGAPDTLLARCTREQVGAETKPLSGERRAEILRANDELAASALRTLGVGLRELPADRLQREKVGERLEQELVFLGLIGMIDPPREEAKRAVALARGAGIRPIMVTGDHAKTAAAIAGELGISSDGRVVSGAELETLSDEELVRTTREISVFARVNPSHKLRIVKALQSDGATVALTGDGVNDAPALKAADIGIAMGITGTDVSKEAADVVLTDDNFATIVAAVEEGRSIFSNIRKFLRYLLSSNIGEVMTMSFGVLFAKVIGPQAGGGDLALPLLATQILWINLLTDGAPALALGLDPVDAGVMDRPPRPRSEGVITRQMWSGILTVALIMAAGTLFIFYGSLPGGWIAGSGDLKRARTMAFTTLIAFQMFDVFNVRSDERSAFEGWFRNRWLWAAVGASIALQVPVIYAPFLQKAFSTVALTGRECLLCVSVASSVLWLREAGKFFTRMRSERASAPGPGRVA